MNYIRNTVGSPHIGSIYEGVVVKLMDFGAFVDFGFGKDGMVHISEVAPHRIDNIGNELSVGDKVKVKFIGFDPKGRVKLSMKRALPGAEDDVREEDRSRPEREGLQPSIGEVYDGAVTKVMDFGAFVDFGFRKDGMVHISEVAPQRVEDIHQFLSIGDVVRVKFLGFDNQGRTKLSIKQVD